MPTLNYFFLIIYFALAHNAIVIAQIPFGSAQLKSKLEAVAINEASGLEASKNNKGLLWTHNDSGDQARIFLLSKDAACIGTYYLEGVEARDWEEIGSMEQDGVTFLIVGDIGDNRAKYQLVYLHVFEEPTRGLEDSVYVDTIRKADIKTFALTYPDGARDAESLFFDPLSKRLYIITKRELEVGLYSCDLSSEAAQPLMLQKEANLPYTFITSAAISRDGTELLIKNLLEVHYWKRKTGENIKDMLQRPSIKLPYKAEPQGEGICFAENGNGYYTISERPFGLNSYLIFYPRIE